MQLRRQTTGQRLAILPDREIGAGGQARIYALPGDASLVAKIFRDPRDEYARKLAVMLANPPSDPSGAQGHASIAWPIDLLVSPEKKNRVVGYVMPRAFGAAPILERYNPALRRRECPLFNYLYLHRTARNLAAVFHALHLRDYVIGDVNESNILVTDTALVTLVDTDSFQVRDREQNAIFRCPVGRPEFTPPELQGKAFHYITRTPEHDCFGLAVMIFQLLMEGTHPFAGIYTGSGDPPPYEARIAGGYFPYGAARLVYRPLPYAPPLELLPPALWELFARCFEEGHVNPAARPEAQTWVLALREAEQNLALCPVNDQHHYGNHLPACPWCARTELLKGRDPFPSRQSVEGAADSHVLTTVQASLPSAAVGRGGENASGGEKEKRRRGEEEKERSHVGGTRQPVGAQFASAPHAAPAPQFAPASQTAPVLPTSGNILTSPASQSSSASRNSPIANPAAPAIARPAPAHVETAGRRWIAPVGVAAAVLIAGGIFVFTRPRQPETNASLTGAKTHVTASASSQPLTPSTQSSTPNPSALAALVSAINKGDVAEVQTLLAQTPQLAQQTGKGNWTPLHYAAYKGNADIAQQLLAVGAVVDAAEKDGYTPLHFAAQEGHLDMAKLLLENGADTGLKENKGLTALAVAVKAKQSAIAALLRQKGAAPSP